MHSIKLVTLLGLAFLAASCSTPSPKKSATTIYLLGEVHDNPLAHQARLEFMSSLQLDKQPMVSLIMEQFDRENQNKLDQALSECNDAACIAEKAGTKGWKWELYYPIIQMALQNKWPIIAGNISRQDMAQAMREGAEAVLPPDAFNYFKPYSSDPPTDYLEMQTAEIVKGHCNLLPADMASGMVGGQLSRDIFMAYAVKEQTFNGGTAILIAGNGHVRNDLGVPFWLSKIGKDNWLSAGFVESESKTSGPNAPFDLIVDVAPFERPDPCLELKKHFLKPIHTRQSTKEVR